MSIQVRLDITIERNGGEFIPWDIVLDESDVPEPFDNEWDDTLGLFKCGIWDLPVHHTEAETGDCFHITGDLDISFTQDYYGEHDMHCDMANETCRKVYLPIWPTAHGMGITEAYIVRKQGALNLVVQGVN